MSSLLRKLNVGAFCLLGATLACVLIARRGVQVVPVVRAQDRTLNKLRSIEIWNPDPRNPVSIVGISAGKQAISPRDDGNGTGAAQFSAQGNWLADLSFRLRNETAKNIFHIQILVGFPEFDKGNGKIATLPFDFRSRRGDEPLAEDASGPGAPVYIPFRLAPGAEMTISLADYAGQVGELIGEGHSLSTVNRVRIVIVLVEFEGRTLSWYNRRYHLCHPDQPGDPCDNLDENYFPGPRSPGQQ